MAAPAAAPATAAAPTPAPAPAAVKKPVPAPKRKPRARRLSIDAMEDDSGDDAVPETSNISDDIVMLSDNDGENDGEIYADGETPRGAAGKRQAVQSPTSDDPPAQRRRVNDPVSVLRMVSPFELIPFGRRPADRARSAAGHVSHITAGLRRPLRAGTAQGVN